MKDEFAQQTLVPTRKAGWSSSFLYVNKDYNEAIVAS